MAQKADWNQVGALPQTTPSASLKNVKPCVLMSWTWVRSSMLKLPFKIGQQILRFDLDLVRSTSK